MANIMLTIGHSGIKSYQNYIDTTANNIANINTTGYKKNEAIFKDLMYAEQTLPVINDVQNTFNQGFGVRTDTISKDFRQGALQQTGDGYNFAITGNGYFAVENQTTGEIYLTRDGSFSLNADGILVDKNGNQVMTAPTEEDGAITNTPILYMPNQTANMQDIGNNYYSVEAESLISQFEAPEMFGQIQTGYLEMSNVNLATEMTDLIIAQRAYSMNLKSIQTADENMAIVNSLRS